MDFLKDWLEMGVLGGIISAIDILLLIAKGTWQYSSIWEVCQLSAIIIIATIILGPFGLALAAIAIIFCWTAV